MSKKLQEHWKSPFGAIMAVAGGAVGLGNFIRFPGQVAQYGGASFMIAYIVSFLILALPIALSEWSLGKRGGLLGYNSPCGIFYAVTKKSWGKYLGVLTTAVTMTIFFYYVLIESWCLGYAVNFLTGSINFTETKDATNFLVNFIGASENGQAFGLGLNKVGYFLIVSFLINLFLIYKGVSKGIEFFCKIAMPALLIISIIILIRVVTLGTPDPTKPENSISNGLGYIWNPTKVYVEHFDTNENVWSKKEQIISPSIIKEYEEKAKTNKNIKITKIGLLKSLLNPSIWFAAAGQVFFSLSVGFGLILNYASYLKKKDDVVLPCLSAASTNELFEISIGGFITIPAAVAFLGLTSVVSMGLSTFTIGFQTMPLVFSKMWMGEIFGFLFFFLLWLAAITSCISMIQPSVALLEEALNLRKKASVVIIGFIALLGSLFVAYFSKDTKSLDVVDFFAANFFIYLMALIQIIVFSWFLKIEDSIKILNTEAKIKIPMWTKYIFKYITPAILLIVFLCFIFESLGVFSGNKNSVINAIFVDKDLISILSLSLILSVCIFFMLIVKNSKNYNR